MEDLQQIRRQNLLALIGNNTMAEYAREHDLDASYLSQIKNGSRGFGEKAARKMEEKIGLPKYALDIKAGESLACATEEELIGAVAEVLPRLSGEAKKKLIRLVSEHL